MPTSGVVLLLTALLLAPATLAKSKGPTIETSFHGHADYGRYSTYAWVPEAAD